MKNSITLLLLCAAFASCNIKSKDPDDRPVQSSLVGTWKLLNGTLIEKGDTTVTDYTRDVSFIKIINDTHFAFLNHDLRKGADSGKASYSSGGGTYKLHDSTYTEHLEYCNARNWEGNDFTFTVTLKGDTMIQQGIEKIESEGVDRINVEKYVKLSK